MTREANNPYGLSKLVGRRRDERDEPSFARMEVAFADRIQHVDEQPTIPSQTPTQINDVDIVQLALSSQMQYRVNEYTRARNQFRKHDFEDNIKLAKRALAELDNLHVDKLEPFQDHLRNDSITNYP